jgi:hypothetical protein
MKLNTVIAAMGCLVIGCTTQAPDDGDEFAAACPSIIGSVGAMAELPDYNATLSTDVDVYIASTDHSGLRQYTIPSVIAPDEMLVSKTMGYCDHDDAMSFVDENGYVLVDIATDDAKYGCKGWARLMTVGDDNRWQLVEFGGDAYW